MIAFRPGDRVRVANTGPVATGTVQLMRGGKVKVRWDRLGWPTSMVNPEDIEKVEK